MAFQSHGTQQTSLVGDMMTEEQGKSGIVKALLKTLATLPVVTSIGDNESHGQDESQGSRTYTLLMNTERRGSNISAHHP